MPQLFYIYGYYGSKNAGDEVFRLAFQTLLPATAELRFIRPSELADNRDLAERITQDCKHGLARLIVGGGAIIGEPYFWQHLPEHTPFHIISADIGSEDNLLRRYRPSLQPLQASWIRSETDTETLRRLAPWQPQIQHLPDLVFALEADSTHRQAVAALPQDARNRQLLERMAEHCENTISPSQLRNKNLAIFLSDHYYDYKTIHSRCVLDGIERQASDTIYLRELRQALDSLTPYYNLYLFSLSYWYNAIDAVVGYHLARASSQAPLYNLVTRYIDPGTILQLMPYFDAAISTKFHGLILPMTANVPVLNLGSSKKNRDLSQQMGLAALPPEEFSQSRFLSTLKLVESVEYATSLAETRRLAHEAIHTTFADPELWR